MSGYIPFPDGTRRVFTTLYVIPKGVVTSTPAPAGNADLGKPWAAFGITVYGGDGSSSGGLGASASCSVLVNPTAWRDATAGPTVQGANGPERTVGGMQFTASCPNDPLYSTYTVTFDSAVLDGRPSTVYRYSRPQPTYETFSADAPLAANGTLEASTVSVEDATMTVCGRRYNGTQECHGNLPGGARIYVDVESLVMKAYSS